MSSLGVAFAAVVLATATFAQPRAQASSDAEALLAGAVQRVEQARELKYKTGNRTALASAMDGVIADLSRAAAAFERAGATRQRAQCAVELAFAHQFKGREEQARTLFDDAARVATAMHCDAELVRALVAHAKSLLYVANDRAGAERLLERALHVDPTVAPRWTAEAHIVRAECLQEKGELAAALDEVLRASEAAATDAAFLYARRTGCASIYADIAATATRETVSEYHFTAIRSAIEESKSAIALAEQQGWKAAADAVRPTESSARMRLALLTEEAKFQKTLRSFRDVLANPKKPEDVLVTETFGVGGPGFDAPAELSALMESGYPRDASEASMACIRAGFDAATGKVDEALRGYLNAVALLDREYRSLTDPDARLTLLAPRIDFYYFPMLMLLEKGDHQAAFELLESSKARVLSDLLLTRDRIRVGDEAQRRLYERLCDTRKRLAEAQASTADGAAASIVASEEQYRATLKEVREKAPTLLELVAASPVALAATRDAAVQGKCDVLEYLCLDAQLVVWHIGPSGVHVRSVGLLRTHLQQLVGELLASLGDPSKPFAAETARQLEMFLIEPIAQFITTERLVIVPHQDLHRLPFEALRHHADGKYLAERFAVTYLPSARFLPSASLRRPLGDASALALAGPDLPEAARENEAVVRSLGRSSRALTVEQSTPAYLALTASTYEVIHIAAHGFFDTRFPMRSAIQLGTVREEWLTAAAMYALPLGKARLVTLSACESGQSQGLETGELLGFPRALLHAGADAVLLSRWRVDSAATEELMTAFYAAAATHPLDVALQRAAKSVRANAPHAHPYYWAAFYLIGG